MLGTVWPCAYVGDSWLLCVVLLTELVAFGMRSSSTTWNSTDCYVLLSRVACSIHHVLLFCGVVLEPSCEGAHHPLCISCGSSCTWRPLRAEQLMLHVFCCADGMCVMVRAWHWVEMFCEPSF
jgi:hypothetical protein